MGISVLFWLAIIFAAAAIISAIYIVKILSSRKISSNILFWGLFFVKYLRSYKKLSISEKGNFGFLFYLYVVSLNIALIALVLAVLTSV